MRTTFLRRVAFVVSAVALVSVLVASSAVADTGGTGLPSSDPPASAPPNPAPGTGGGTAPPPATTPGQQATISADGRTAIPPADAPQPVKNAVDAANKITTKPYVWGGGHRRWKDRGYDCSGAASYVLHGAGLLDAPADAVVLGHLSIMDRGPGQWISYYWNHQHGYMVIAGLRFDTAGPGPRGPRWRKSTKVTWSKFYARHPEGL